MSRRLLWLAVAAALVILAGGCAKPSSAPLPPEEFVGERTPYVIGIPDILRITVWKNPELSTEVPVRRDGMISVPLADDVQAEGLTPAELKVVLTRALSDFISAPDVTVTVIRPESHSVVVIGAVLRSGTVPLTRDMRVLDAIAVVGGFNNWARKNNIRVLRPSDEGVLNYRFNYGAFVNGDAPGTNLVLKPGDTIVVPD